MSQFVRPTPNVTCPHCRKQGIIDGSDFSIMDRGHEPDTSSIVFKCRFCNQLIPISRDKVAVSPDPLFQIIGMLGTLNGMLQLLDRNVCGPIVLPDSGGHERVISSGTAKIQITDPETGAVLSETEMYVGEEPTFLLSPGVWRDEALAEPADRILVLLLKALVPAELESKVQLWSQFLKGSDGRYSSIRIAAVTSAPEVLPDEKLNAICHFFVIPSMSKYAPWLRQMIKGSEQSAAGNFEAAILDYARACELFIGDYLRKTLKREDGLDDKSIDKRMNENRSVWYRVAKLLPLVSMDKTAYREARQAWNVDVKKVRDDDIAHVSIDVTEDQARKAHDAAYWFIRAIQSQCKFKEGRQWDFWASSNNTPGDSSSVI